jgi:hypothetical protein
MLKFRIFLEKTCVTKKLAYLYTMTNANNTPMITNKRIFAIALSKGEVNKATVSIKLERIVNLWLSRNEIIETSNGYQLA